MAEVYAAGTMATSPAPDPHKARRRQIRQVWQRCVREEKLILAASHAQLLEEFKDSLTFGQLPLSPETYSWSDERMAQNYRYLLKMLRQAGSRDDKMKLPAMWLRQEGIMQPSEFLPVKLRKELIRSTLKAMDWFGWNLSDISASEWKYAAVSRAWKPYFELMQDEYKHRDPSDTRYESKILRDWGFRATAVNAALASGAGLATPREAACRFAAHRIRGVDEDTVLAAYSKVYPEAETYERRRKIEAAKAKKKEEEKLKEEAKRAGEQAASPQKPPSTS
jgi:hypothetical protein